MYKQRVRKRPRTRRVRTVTGCAGQCWAVRATRGSGPLERVPGARPLHATLPGRPPRPWSTTLSLSRPRPKHRVPGKATVSSTQIPTTASVLRCRRLVAVGRHAERDEKENGNRGSSKSAHPAGGSTPGWPHSSPPLALAPTPAPAGPVLIDSQVPLVLRHSPQTQVPSTRRP